MGEQLLTANERIEKLKEEFTKLASWEDRYRLVIEKGKKLETLPEAQHTEDLKVKGCQSQVWLYASLSPRKTVLFQADSDAVLVKGLVAILVEVYSDLSPTEILSTSPQFLKDLGFETHLSPNRASGLFAMAKQIQHYATAFQALLSMQSKS